MNPTQRVFCIAEIGINHNGSVELAKQLIDLACEAGFDAVKFQKRTIELVYSAEQLAQPRVSPWGSTFRQQKEGLELSEADYLEIDRYCRQKGISWSASAWDPVSQEFLRRFERTWNKIASPMLTDLEFVDMVAQERLPTYVSTGMSTMDQIAAAVEVFRRRDCPFTLMHCVSTYPADVEELNLRCIQTLRERFGCPVGYSGHERSLWPTIAAIGLGASAIERHITLDRTMYGSDQAASLEPDDLRTLIRAVREVERSLGDGRKRIWPSEIPVMKKLRSRPCASSWTSMERYAS